MNMTKKLHDLGQSLWLDNITREHPRQRHAAPIHRRVLSVTGLTSNPTIFDEAIGGSSFYDDGIRKKAQAGAKGEALFVDLALEDLQRAADLFRPVFDRTEGVDGWVSMEVSPLLGGRHAIDHRGGTQHPQARRPAELVRENPRHAGRRARDRGGHFCRCARERHPAVLARAIPRRGGGLHARPRAPHRRQARPAGQQLRGVALRQPLGQGRRDKVPAELRNRLGIAIAARTYKAHCDLVKTERWRALRRQGRAEQRMLWASTGHQGSESLADALCRGAGGAGYGRHHARKNARRPRSEQGEPGSVAPLTAGRRRCGTGPRALRRGRHRRGRTREKAAAGRRESFVKSWKELMQSIADKSATLATT